MKTEKGSMNYKISISAFPKQCVAMPPDVEANSQKHFRLF